MASALALQPEIFFGLICHCLNCNYHCQDHIFIKKFVFPQFISSSYDRSRADIFWKINGCWCWAKPTSIFLKGLLVGLGWQLRQLGRTDTYRRQTLKKTEEKTKQNKTKWLFSTGMIKIFIIDIITPVERPGGFQPFLAHADVSVQENEGKKLRSAVLTASLQCHCQPRAFLVFSCPAHSHEDRKILGFLARKSVKLSF